MEKSSEELTRKSCGFKPFGREIISVNDIPFYCAQALHMLYETGVDGSLEDAKVIPTLSKVDPAICMLLNSFSNPKIPLCRSDENLQTYLGLDNHEPAQLPAPQQIEQDYQKIIQEMQHGWCVDTHATLPGSYYLFKEGTENTEKNHKFSTLMTLLAYRFSIQARAYCKPQKICIRIDKADWEKFKTIFQLQVDEEPKRIKKRGEKRKRDTMYEVH